MAPELGSYIRGLGLDLSFEQLDRLARYRDLLATSSREFNLTSLRDAGQIERRHLVESLAFGVLLQRHALLPAAGSESGGGPRALDVGTGAGLPGLPLKIAWPGILLVLLESVGKKCRFLEDVSARLGLDDVKVIEARAEDAGRDQALRESFDLVIARAVAPLPVLLEYTLPFLRVGGRLAATKGSAALSEIDASRGALPALGGRLFDAVPFEPPDGMRQTVIIVEKTAPTLPRYPRRPGMPSKRPIV